LLARRQVTRLAVCKTEQIAEPFRFTLL